MHCPETSIIWQQQSVACASAAIMLQIWWFIYLTDEWGLLQLAWQVLIFVIVSLKVSAGISGINVCSIPDSSPWWWEEFCDTNTTDCLSVVTNVSSICGYRKVSEKSPVLLGQWKYFIVFRYDLTNELRSSDERHSIFSYVVFYFCSFVSASLISSIHVEEGTFSFLHVLEIQCLLQVLPTVYTLISHRIF